MRSGVLKNKDLNYEVKWSNEGQYLTVTPEYVLQR